MKKNDAVVNLKFQNRLRQVFKSYLSDYMVQEWNYCLIWIKMHSQDYWKRFVSDFALVSHLGEDFYRHCLISNPFMLNSLHNEICIKLNTYG